MSCALVNKIYLLTSDLNENREYSSEHNDALEHVCPDNGSHSTL